MDDVEKRLTEIRDFAQDCNNETMAQLAEWLLFYLNDDCPHKPPHALHIRSTVTLMTFYHEVMPGIVKNKAVS